MRRVASADIRPNHCAALPQLGARAKKGYFDTGIDLNGFDNHVYVSVEFVEMAARDLAWTGPQERQELRGEIEALQGQIQALTVERDELAGQLDAVHVLKQAGYQAARKPGRPKREAVA